MEVKKKNVTLQKIKYLFTKKPNGDNENNLSYTLVGFTFSLSSVILIFWFS